MKAKLVLAMVLVLAGFAVAGPQTADLSQPDRSNAADAIGTSTGNSGMPRFSDGFTYTVEWYLNVPHLGVVGLTPVQDTLLWVSSGGATGNTDTNMILIYDLRTMTKVDSFKQYIHDPTSAWGYRDMTYDPVEDAVYAGCESNRLDKINATTKALIATYTVSGSGTPSIVRALGYDGDSLFSANFTSAVVSKFSKTGTGCRQVAPIPPLAIYGLAVNNAKTYAYGTTGDYTYYILRYNYTSGACPLLS